MIRAFPARRASGMSLAALVAFLPPNSHAAADTAGITAYHAVDGIAETKSGMTIFGVSTQDESGIIVKNGGSLTFTSGSVSTASSGVATSQYENSSFYGNAAGVLVKSGSTASFTDSRITTTGGGANGFSVYGVGAVLHLVRDTITCSGNFAHGVNATGTGTITMEDVVINTTGTKGGSGAVSTDRGSGTVTGVRVKGHTTGTGSPGIYSTGVVTMDSSVFVAEGSQGIIMEGLNQVILHRTSVTGAATKPGCQLFQSGSGDSKNGLATVLFDGGSFRSNGPSLFYVANTEASVTLKNGVNVASSGVLCNAAAGSWGTAGRNGGHAAFHIDSNQTVEGGFTLDSVSSIAVFVRASSSLTGYVDTVGKGATSVTLDATSTWTVTKTSHVDTIVDPSIDTGALVVPNIVGRGFDVRYQPAANPGLGGKTYGLAGTMGGCLLPVGSTATCAATIVRPRSEAGVGMDLRGRVLEAHFDGASRATLSVSDLSGRVLLRRTIPVHDGIARGVLPAGFRGRTMICRASTDDGRVVQAILAMP